MLSYLFRPFNAFDQPMVSKNVKLVSFLLFYREFIILIFYLGLWSFSLEFLTESC